MEQRRRHLEGYAGAVMEGTAYAEDEQDPREKIGEAEAAAPLPSATGEVDTTEVADDSGGAEKKNELSLPDSAEGEKELTPGNDNEGAEKEKELLLPDSAEIARQLTPFSDTGGAEKEKEDAQKAQKTDYSEKAFDQEIRDLRNRRKALSVGFANSGGAYSGLSPETKSRRWSRDLDLTP